MIRLRLGVVITRAIIGDNTEDIHRESQKKYKEPLITKSILNRIFKYNLILM